ncbi:hypothetical protein J6590_015627 [Homalodisca vitripennis]|nr:hypothetical protein J6590_015627 [Homalodisca vitripennis]
MVQRRVRLLGLNQYSPDDCTGTSPETIERLVLYFKRRKSRLVIDCVANTHYMIWGSSDTNERGECFYEYLVSKD